MFSQTPLFSHSSFVPVTLLVIPRVPWQIGNTRAFSHESIKGDGYVQRPQLPDSTQEALYAVLSTRERGHIRSLDRFSRQDLSDGTCERRMGSKLKEDRIFNSGILKDAANGRSEEYRGLQVLLPVSRPLLIRISDLAHPDFREHKVIFRKLASVQHLKIS